jgi:hypothetical protein
VLHIDLASGYKFTDVIKVSFSGNILAKDGTSLQPFTLEDIENLLPSVHLIPGRVQAEDYLNSVGISLETCTDISGGQNLAYLDPGDYVDYEVLVLNSGMHKADFRTASQSPGALNIQIVDSIGNILSNLGSANFPATGDWQDWETYSFNVPLTAGEQILRLTITQAPFNLNWIEFWFGGIGLNPGLTNEKILVYPNPSKEHQISIEVNEKMIGSALTVTNYLHQKVHEIQINERHTNLNLSHLPKGLYLMKFHNNSDKSTVLEKIILQ